MNDVRYAVWLAENCGACSPLAKALIDEYGSSESVYRAGGLPKTVAGKNVPRDFGLRCTLEKAERIVEECERQNVSLIALEDDRFPERLREIDDPPAVLYAKGDCSLLFELDERPALAMVGPRDMTLHGQKAAYDFAYSLAKGGMLIVSGLAEGIDGTSHKGALAAGGKTIAVLGCGVDITYPKCHYYLQEQIEREGLVLSEYPPKTPAHGYHFPQRNRIISGLSGAVFVVESRTHSGSLITANYAAEQGRDVHVLMTDYNRRGASVLARLINDGANMVSEPADIAETYLPRFKKRLDLSAVLRAMPPQLMPEPEPSGTRTSRRSAGRRPSRKKETEKPVTAAPEKTARHAPEGVSENALTVYGVLDTTDPTHVDEIVEKTGLSVSAVSAALMELELNRSVKALPGRHYLVG